MTTDAPAIYDPPAASSCGTPKWLISSIDEYETMYRRSIDDPAGFWGDAARQLHWFTPFHTVLEFEAPDAEWFLGGTTNLCYNCVDRHVEQGHGSQVGIVWEGEPIENGTPEVRHLTYAEIQEQTAKFASVLKSKGVKKGDVVTIYMGMVPELAIATLACVRIGAVHSVIFGGFSASAIADRVIDASSRVIVTCDGAWRRGSIVPLKANVDEAVKALADQGHALDACVVVKRVGNDVAMSSHDSWWHEDMANASADCPCEPVDSEHMAFLLYTSGSTGKPKGIQHTTGGYMVFTYLTSKYVFNLIPDLDTPKRDSQSGQLFWCTADVGWITGHSYILYGIMSNRVPTLLYEGAPNHPDASRFWDMVERHKVTQFYTAPTAIRAFMKWGDAHVEKHDLSSLQVLGSVGEPATWSPRCPAAPPPSPARARGPSSASMPPSSPPTARKSPPAKTASWSSASPGPPCSAASTATASATSIPIGAPSPVSTPPATAPRKTPTAASGSPGGSTTSSTSRATGWAPWRSRARW